MMYIANGKQFGSYEQLVDWCIDEGVFASQFQPVTESITLVQVKQLDEHDASILRDQRRRREQQEESYAAERNFYGQ